MKKMHPLAHIYYSRLFVSIITMVSLLTACQKDHIQESAATTDEPIQTDGRHGQHFSNLKGFLQVNLVANNGNYNALRTDPALVNGWGIAFSSTGTAWIGAQGGHVSTVYNRDGGQVLEAVNIPSPGGAEGGNPTGVVFSGSATDFIIPSGNVTPASAARFIFAGVDGIVSAWNGTWGNHVFKQLDNSSTSSYTGLTLATYRGKNYLYAADFRGGKIDVWDNEWNPVTTMSFRDRRLPREASPFNIQVIGEYLIVTYAKIGPDGRSEAGPGLGIVNVFTTNGRFVSRFADGDQLNAPWGVAMAPPAFFPTEDIMPTSSHHNNEPQPSLLVGNFGDGKISVYDLNGKFLGLLRSSDKKPLVIDGLWALMFPPTTSTIDPNRLYFAAGPNLETDGLFGYIIKDSLTVSN